MLVRRLLFSLLIFSPCAFAKIASFDLCADQWLMTFARPDQVAFLTPLSQDKKVSYHFDKSAEFKTETPNLETLLTRNVGTILVTNGMDATTRQTLERNGIHVVVIPPIKTVQDLKKAAQKVCDLTGGDTKIIQELHNIIPSNPKNQKALYVGVANSSPGRGTLVDEAFLLAGLQNIMANSYKDWGYVDTEFILKQRPDYIFTSDMPSHKLSFVGYPPYKHLSQAKVNQIPHRHTICACPGAFMALLKDLQDAQM